MNRTFCLLLSLFAALACCLSPVSAQGKSGSTIASQSKAAAAGRIKIETYSTDDETIKQVLEFLQEKTEQEGKPLRFTYVGGKGATGTVPRVGQMVVRDVTVAECLELCCRLCRCDYAVKKNTVTVFPSGSQKPVHFPKSDAASLEREHDTTLTDGDTADEGKKAGKKQKKSRKARKKH